MPLNIADTPTNTEAETFLNGMETTVDEHEDKLTGVTPIATATIESATVEKVVMATDTLTYAATVDIDFDADTVKYLALTGNVTFTTSNKANGKTATIFITADGTNRTFTFPAWDFFGEEPTGIAAGEEGVITLFCKGSADTDIRAVYAVTGGGVPVTTDGVQTLTNKTLTSPTLTTPVLGTPTSGNLSSCTADGTNAVGFRHIPQNSQSTAYTTVLADAGKHILHPSADTTARTFTIDSNANVAYPLGTALTFVNQNSAGVVTIAITSDTMRLAGAGTTGNRTLAANGVATAIKVTSTEWIVSGTGLT